MSDWSEADRKEIEKIAYFKWLDAGSPSNQESQFWQDAENEYTSVIEVTYPPPRPYYHDTWLSCYYHPYIPLSQTPVVLDPDVFSYSYSSATNLNNNVYKVIGF